VITFPWPICHLSTELSDYQSLNPAQTIKLSKADENVISFAKVVSVDIDLINNGLIAQIT